MAIVRCTAIAVTAIVRRLSHRWGAYVGVLCFLPPGPLTNVNNSMRSSLPEYDVVPSAWLAYFGAVIIRPAGLQVPCSSWPSFSAPSPAQRHLPPRTHSAGILGFQPPHCLRMEGECLPHEADLPTTQAPLSSPPSILGRFSPPGSLLVSVQRQVLHLFTFGDLVF